MSNAHGTLNPPPVFMKLYDGRGNPAPTLTFSAYEAFGIIRGLFFCQGRGEVSSPANDYH
jgi:hypothetical protein